ncbi:hypothetical protein Vadar_003992 [Vaccinium darrowii]|uniref:Uncharacterized protein n=1 Tax=Vaccinium darrowii TaxID=229202 RepID=A0ACB7X7Y1_9ERIC|nr:hypothetical protein Vadar_003992 [Vaccinium darrowii]
MNKWERVPQSRSDGALARTVTLGRPIQPQASSYRTIYCNDREHVRGRVVSWSSAGTCGFRGRRRGTPFAAQTAVGNAIRTVVDHQAQLQSASHRTIITSFMERAHSPSRKKVSNVEGEGQEVKNEADFETFNPMDTGHFDRGLNRMRFKEAEAEAVTENSFPVMQTKLISLEKHGAELFTRKIFSFFREEIEKEGVLVLNNKIDRGDHRIYYLGKYSSKSTWRLEYHPSLGTIKCSCLKLESFGIPCCHMIFVMKCEQLISIPLGCFMPRWARRASLERQQPSLPKISQTLTQTARYAMLSSSYNEMAYYASHLDAEFDEAREIAFRMTCRMKKRWEMINNISNNDGEMGNGGNSDGAEENIASKLFGVRDPIVVNTKGNPGGSSSRGVPPKARRCGHCRCIGHTKRTCKKFVGSKQKDGSENDTQEATNVEFTSLYPDDTHGKPGGSSSGGVPPKARTCGRCKGIGHTKRMCENLDVRNQKEGSENDMQKATNAEFISSYQNDNHHSASEPRLYKPNHEATVSTDGMWLQS